jgi:hypothetical protein
MVGHTARVRGRNVTALLQYPMRPSYWLIVLLGLLLCAVVASVALYPNPWRGY